MGKKGRITRYVLFVCINITEHREHMHQVGLTRIYGYDKITAIKPLELPPFVTVRGERNMENMTNQEINEAIEKVKFGDNAAWKKLHDQFGNYVHDRTWKRLKKLNMPESRKEDTESELFQAGWEGFLSAIRNYDPEKGAFLTYATYYIDGAMSREIKFIIHPLEMTKQSEDIDDMALASAKEKKYSVSDAPDCGKYSAERRVLQILEILRILTDEEHSLSKEELRHLLWIYRTRKYRNGTPIEASNTFTSTIEEILAEVNPAEYSEQNEDQY